MSVWLAILLGLVQGVTEFIPVSSSGHLAALEQLFHVTCTEQQLLFFNTLLHLGTLVAVCIVCREDIVKMARGGVRLLQGQMDFSVFGDPLIPATRQLLCIALGTLPLLLALLLRRVLLARMPSLLMLLMWRVRRTSSRPLVTSCSHTTQKRVGTWLTTVSVMDMTNRRHLP